MEYEVEYTDIFEGWWHTLTEGEQEDVSATVGLLEELGPNLGFPHSSAIKGKASSKIRELRVQHGGKPYRVLYAFDPRRVAILLLGGCKVGDSRWYEKFAPKAEALFSEHLEEIKEEKNNG